MKVPANISVRNMPYNADLQRISISITGNFSVRINYVFEIYRLAEKFKLKGFIRRLGEESLDIEAEGVPLAMGYLKKELKALFSRSDVRITFNTKDYLLNYNEFRILKY